MARRYRNGWWLEIKYWDEGLTQREIGEECGVSASTVRKQMKRLGVPTRDMAGEDHPLYGRERTEEVKAKISSTMEGRSFSDETRERIAEAQRGSELPTDVRQKISRSLQGISRSRETRRKMSRSTAGERNPNWSGGYSRRYGVGWAEARERVWRRDSVCQHCGHEGAKRTLDVHHIVPVRLFRETEGVALEAAHDDRNLVLLCKRCHSRAEHGQIDVQPSGGFSLEECLANPSDSNDTD
ncbi:NUMOD3 domain-containing DNA-binding protein [Halococcus agarilyticus]|uniref:NUMOD3 domain-containing DNA-binding protein n=1 Tax=Halococcus agarilyticus TaxID=1232219 RepID=UPI0006780560|nr:NUMOD3 domain-containing DNA-binding protein [Halococcus agarilyticus]